MSRLSLIPFDMQRCWRARKRIGEITETKNFLMGKHDYKDNRAAPRRKARKDYRETNYSIVHWSEIAVDTTLSAMNS